MIIIDFFLIEFIFGSMFFNFKRKDVYFFFLFYKEKEKNS